MSYKAHENEVIATENGLYKGTLTCSDESDANAALDLLLSGDDPDVVADLMNAEWTY